MSNVEKNDWHKVERKGNVIEYTDSDGVWMKEKYNDKGNIISRKDSFGNWDKFEYVKIEGKNETKVTRTQGPKK